MNKHSHDTRSAIENEKKTLRKKPPEDTVEKPHVFSNYISRNQSHTMVSTANIKS